MLNNLTALFCVDIIKKKEDKMKTKKIISLVVVFALLITSSVMLFACGSKKEAKVMNLGINPEIELVLDKNNNVISVNALNDEGNYIVANVKFEGLSVNDAVEKFIQANKDSGFVSNATVSATNNELKISISGDSADSLYKKVKKTADKYFEEINISANVSFSGKLDKSYLESQVKDCMRELSSSEISNMTEEQLINLLKESREETKDIFTQELKDLYYQSRAEEVLTAKINKLKDLAKNNPMFNAVVDNINTALNELIDKTDDFRQKIEEKYLSDTSDYQIKMNEFITKKKELLKARLDGADETVLRAKELAVTSTENLLQASKTQAELVIATVETGINTAITTINTLINSFVSSIDTAQIESAVDTATTTLVNEFKTQYADYNNYWKNFKVNE